MISGEPNIIHLLITASLRSRTFGNDANSQIQTLVIWRDEENIVVQMGGPENININLSENRGDD